MITLKSLLLSFLLTALVRFTVDVYQTREVQRMAKQMDRSPVSSLGIRGEIDSYNIKYGKNAKS